jgi:hypothetical protein
MATTVPRLIFLAMAVASLSGCVVYLNPQCDDQIANGDETGVDCGGPCNKCDVGERCRVTADCAESTCEGGTCTPLQCANSVRDGDETDVDCGGIMCRKCAGGQTCVEASDCFNNNCVIATSTCFALDAVSFADEVSYESGEKTYAIFSGDLDGDRDVDLAAANEQASNLSVFINNGSGTFQKLATQFGTGDYPTGGAAIDMNKDGILDIVTADYHGDSVSVLLGMGAGALRPKSTYPTVEGAETSNLAVGDLNGDAIPDIVATNPSASSTSLFLANADGTLKPGVQIPVGVAGSGAPFSAAIGDFNGDGRNDIAVANMGDRSIGVRFGNGDGTFQDEVSYPEGGLPAYILVAHDMNLDDRLDLVIANRGSNDVSVLLGRADGTFRKPLVSSVGAMTGPYSVAVADFNQDSVPDVVTANFMSSSISILIGKGDGRFAPAIDGGPTGLVSYGVIANDLNGDLKPDVATANASSNSVSVKFNTSK